MRTCACVFVSRWEACGCPWEPRCRRGLAWVQSARSKLERCEQVHWNLSARADTSCTAQTWSGRSVSRSCTTTTSSCKLGTFDLPGRQIKGSKGHGCVGQGWLRPGAAGGTAHSRLEDRADQVEGIAKDTKHRQSLLHSGGVNDLGRTLTSQGWRWTDRTCSPGSLAQPGPPVQRWARGSGQWDRAAPPSPPSSKAQHRGIPLQGGGGCPRKSAAKKIEVVEVGTGQRAVGRCRPWFTT